MSFVEGKIVFVDESVSDSNIVRFKQFAEKKGLALSDYHLVRQLHSGMPDGQIIHHLLSGATIFITADRPLHNTVLSKGLVIQLMLNSIETIVYYDDSKIKMTDFRKMGLEELPYQDFFDELSRSYKKLEFVPVSKGRHIEALRKKLCQLASSRDTNEIQLNNLREMLYRFSRKDEREMSGFSV